MRVKRNYRFVGFKLEELIFEELYEHTTREITLSDVLREAAVLWLRQKKLEGRNDHNFNRSDP